MWLGLVQLPKHWVGSIQLFNHFVNGHVIFTDFEGLTRFNNSAVFSISNTAAPSQQVILHTHVPLNYRPELNTLL